MTYPQAGGNPQQGQPGEPWQQGGGGTYYGSQSGGSYQQPPADGYPQQGGGTYGSPQDGGNYGSPQQGGGSYGSPQQGGGYQGGTYGTPQSGYPQQQPSYPPQEATPSYPPPGTQQQPGFPPAPGQAPKKKGKALLIVGVVVGVVLLLCVVGTVVAVLAANSDNDTPPAATDSTGDTDVQGDLDKYKVGDCLTITGASQDVKEAECTAAGAYKVLLRKEGTTSETACEGTEATDVLYQDGVIGTSSDFVLCIAKVA